jgi:hypothetical protein
MLAGIYLRFWANESFITQSHEPFVIVCFDRRPYRSCIGRALTEELVMKLAKLLPLLFRRRKSAAERKWLVFCLTVALAAGHPSSRHKASLLHISRAPAPSGLPGW